LKVYFFYILLISTLIVNSCLGPRIKLEKLDCPEPPKPECTVSKANVKYVYDTVFVDKYAVQSYYKTHWVDGINSKNNEWQISFTNQNIPILTYTDYDKHEAVVLDMIVPSRMRYKHILQSGISDHFGAFSFNGDEVAYAKSNFINDTSAKLPLEDIVGKSFLYTAKINGVNISGSEKINSFTPHLLDWSSHPAYSTDGNVIFFASDMQGGFGGTDIWLIYRQSAGKWSEPINCGRFINTACDEMTPFLNDEKYLYFASNGRDNYGGYDIFRAEIMPALWKVLGSTTNPPFDLDNYFRTPQNLGVTVNSKYDELFPNCLGNCDSLFYFSSNRPAPSVLAIGGYNIMIREKLPVVSLPKQDDVVITGPEIIPEKKELRAETTNINEKIELLVDIKPEVKTLPKFKYSGVVRNLETNLPVSQATVTARNIEQDNIEAETLTNRQGEFSLDLTKGIEYEIVAESDRTFYDTKKVFVDTADTSSTIVEDYILPVKFQLRINFPYDVFDTPYKFVLDSNARELDRTWQQELDILAAGLLRSSDAIREIQLTGHTDNIGGVEYNQILGQQRVEFVIEQLIIRGVPRELLKSRSAGKLEPLERKHNENDEQYRKRLRRVTLEKIFIE